MPGHGKRKAKRVSSHLSARGSTGRGALALVSRFGECEKAPSPLGKGKERKGEQRTSLSERSPA